MPEFRRLTLWQEMATPHLLPLLRALVPRFDRVRLVTLGEIDPVRASIGWDDAVPPGVERLHAPKPADRAAALRASATAFDLNLLQGLKPVHWQWQVQRALVASPASIALLSELHWPGTTPAKRFALSLREHALAKYWRSRSRALFAFGEEAAAHYVAHGFPPQNVHAFGYSPGLSDARPARQPQKEPVIAVAARLSPYKGIDVLLRAMALVADRPWKLEVAGDGPMRSALEDLAGELGVGERITWLGWRPAESIPQIFADADLMVLPSRFEGWGAVVNEALGVGTPVVVSRGAGAHCLVRSPLLGESVPPDDPTTLADAIAHQLDDSVSARREAIRGWSRQAISPAAAADYFMACLAGVRPPPPWRAVVTQGAG